MQLGSRCWNGTLPGVSGHVHLLWHNHIRSTWQSEQTNCLHLRNRAPESRFWASLWLTVLCAMSTSEVYRPLSFMGTMVTRTSQLDVLHSTAPRLLRDYNNDVTIHVPPGRRSPTFTPGVEIISQWCVSRVWRPSCTWYQLASSFTRHHNPWHPCMGLRQGFSLRYLTDMVHRADQQQNRERCNDSWPGYSITSVELSCPQTLLCPATEGARFGHL